MKVAWISPYLPEPAQSGGAIRQQRLAAALAVHAEVHLFARGELWERRGARRLEHGSFATSWLGRDYLPRSPQRCASSRVRRGSPTSLYRAVGDLHRRIGLDIAVVAHSWGAFGASELGLPWLLDEHNIESQYFAELTRAHGGSSPRARHELAAITDWECRAWRSASAICCVSHRDARAIADARPAHEPPEIIANGADLARLVHVLPRDRHGGVLFVGSMHHPPNVDAAVRLTSRILPEVWAAGSDVGLTIVGGPVPSLLRAAWRGVADIRRPKIALAGRVPEVYPHLATARVYANPMQHGAGSSLKVIEALAAGVPLVSTELGARGFGLVPDRHYLLAETDQEQARAIVRVLRDPALARGLSIEGRLLAERYDWAALGASFLGLVERTAARRRL